MIICSDYVSDEFVRFLRDQCLSSNNALSKCNSKTRLYHDLKIYGDDAWIIVNALHDKWGVDLSEFEFKTYFPDEVDILWIIRPLFEFIFPSCVKRYYPITLGDIRLFIKEKKWNVNCKLA